MKTLMLAAATALTLAACGVDGPPAAPRSAAAPQATTTPGVSISGDARIGMRTDDL